MCPQKRHTCKSNISLNVVGFNLVITLDKNGAFVYAERNRSSNEIFNSVSDLRVSDDDYHRLLSHVG